MPFPFPSSEKSDSNLILSFSRHQFLGASAPLWCLDSFQIWESYKGNGVRLTKHIIVLDCFLQKAGSVYFEGWGLNRNLEIRAVSRVTAGLPTIQGPAKATTPIKPYQALVKPFSTLFNPYQTSIKPLSNPFQAPIKPFSKPYQALHKSPFRSFSAFLLCLLIPITRHVPFYVAKWKNKAM